MSASGTTFLRNFTSPSAEDWSAAAVKALKGQPFERLRSKTWDKLDVEPIYERATEARPIAARPAGTPWIISQRIDHPDAGAANALALTDLEGGASGLDLVFAGSAQARGAGLGATTPVAIDALTAGVFLDLVALRIDAGADTAQVAGHLADVAAARGIATPLALALVQDPIGTLAATGRLAVPVEQAIAAAVATDMSRFAPTATAVEADGRVWHAAGASEAQELAAVLATALAYWRAFDAAGVDLTTAAARIGVTLVADQNQFLTIAKFRAFRLLWARVLGAAGVAPVPARLHAETAWRMMAARDPQTNMLRTTVAAFAAGIGGADSVTVLPFTAANGLPDAFARRVARNTQSILIEESNLARVADPAAGSGLVETQTSQLAEAAWALFQAIEAEGGIVAALRSGSLAARVSATADEREAAIARRKEPVTGVSEFPNILETPVATLDATPASAAAQPAAETVARLAPRRVAEPFESLRDRAEAAGGPTVFLANLGRIPDFNARATWVKNFYEAGGIRTLGNDGFGSLAELVEAFKASGTGFACIASSDAIYETEAVEAAQALKAAGARLVAIAGKPKDAERQAALHEAGVDEFVFAGQDAVATLSATLAKLGVA